MNICAHVCGVLAESRGGIESLRVGIMGICELPNLGVRIQTLVLMIEQ